MLNAHGHKVLDHKYIFLNGTTGVFDHAANPVVYPFYGVHPWYADKVEDDWLIQMVARVQAGECGIGEIGLDKACAVNWDKQLAVFDLQLKLAEKFNSPVSLHVVRAWPEILAALKKHKVRALIHQFQGAVEIAQQLLALGCYLSFAPDKYDEAVIKYIPLDKLFLENENEFNPAEDLIVGPGSKNPDSGLAKLYKDIAGIKQISVAKLIEETLKNAETFTHHAFTRGS